MHPCRPGEYSLEQEVCHTCTGTPVRPQQLPTLEHDLQIPFMCGRDALQCYRHQSPTFDSGSTRRAPPLNAGTTGPPTPSNAHSLTRVWIDFSVQGLDDAAIHIPHIPWGADITEIERSIDGLPLDFQTIAGRRRQATDPEVVSPHASNLQRTSTRACTASAVSRARSRRRGWWWAPSRARAASGPRA